MTNILTVLFLILEITVKLFVCYDYGIVFSLTIQKNIF